MKIQKKKNLELPGACEELVQTSKMESFAKLVNGIVAGVLHIMESFFTTLKKQLKSNQIVIEFETKYSRMDQVKFMEDNF